MRANSVLPNRIRLGQSLGGQQAEVQTNVTVGDTVTQRTRQGGVHHYEVVRVEPHVTTSGAATAIVHWRGTCCVCGTEFVTATGRRAHRHMIRTCTGHRGRASLGLKGGRGNA